MSVAVAILLMNTYFITAYINTAITIAQQCVAVHPQNRQLYVIGTIKNSTTIDGQRTIDFDLCGHVSLMIRPRMRIVLPTGFVTTITGVNDDGTQGIRWNNQRSKDFVDKAKYSIVFAKIEDLTSTGVVLFRYKNTSEFTSCDDHERCRDEMVFAVRHGKEEEKLIVRLRSKNLLSYISMFIRPSIVYSREFMVVPSTKELKNYRQSLEL